MDIGDPVVLADGTAAVLLKLPRSEGRKRPRVLVATLNGEQWVPLDELKKREDKELEGSVK
jgi:hypothetical protein